MLSLSKPVAKITDAVLRITENEIVAIEAELSENIEGSNDNLLNLIEEFAFQIRKRKAIPVMEITTERLSGRIIQELTPDKLETPLKYFNKRFELFDAFINIGVTVNPYAEKSLPRRIYNELKDNSEKVFEIARNSQKKFLLVDFPKSGIKEFFNVNYDELQKQIIEAIDCNYSEICDEAQNIQNNILTKNPIKLYTGESNLKITRFEHAYRVYSADFSKENIVSIPTGKIEFPLVSAKTEGEFLAERVYFENNCLENISLSFEEGRVKRITCDNKTNSFYKLQNMLMSLHDESTLIIGLNGKIPQYTSYPSLDECKKEHVGIRLSTDRKQKILLISGKCKVTGE